MKKIILAAMVASAAFAFANPVQAKPASDNIQHSENIPAKKKKVVKKKVNKQAVKVAPEHNAFAKSCGFFDLSCSSSPPKKEEVAVASYTQSDEETAASYWRKESVRQAAITPAPTKKIDTREQRVAIVQDCSWFSCVNGAYQEAKRWEGKTARGNKQELRALFQSGNQQPIDPTRIPWCAAFANAILNRVGYEGTDSLMARSFLALNHKTKEPQIGDIVVLKRGRDKNSGHVGFFEGFEYFEGIKYVKVFGGNTDKSVTTGYFPVTAVLGYRKVA
jgi:uncharacterized protein (TIGR02594 family)